MSEFQLSKQDARRLRELQKKADAPYVPLLDGVLDKMEERATVARMPEMTAAIQAIAGFIAPYEKGMQKLQEDNLRLIYEVRYWKSKCEEIGED